MLVWMVLDPTLRIALMSLTSLNSSIYVILLYNVLRILSPIHILSAFKSQLRQYSEGALTR